MGPDLGTPQGRLANLTTDVSRLEATFAAEFAQWSQHNFPSTAHYFQSSYAEVIDILGHVAEEGSREDADVRLKPNLKALFGRCVGLLSRSVDYIEKADVSLMPVHKALYSDLLRFSQRRDLNENIRPPAREVWAAGRNDLKSDDEFDAKFEKFRNVDQQPRRTQGSYESYARQSWLLLQEACRALHIPEGEAYPGDDFFNNDPRPTYVEYSLRSKEFLYGRGSRPGILALKSRLGAPLFPQQARAIRLATRKRGAGPSQRVLGPKLPNSGDYLLDIREEPRRVWFEKMAHAKLTGQRIPEWAHKKVVDPFTAGGPPDWE
ncbi:hypothetical protein NUW58_g3577 [Xylaria curta]|uniref:Uncharacterized protein n=1 Tax=Xylaria curta TaxID=42375 RepID=A0ACC1PBX1_9PEZI|nr:hypothetical protein NUW58_g3577 [Xylaria curta]